MESGLTGFFKIEHWNKYYNIIIKIIIQTKLIRNYILNNNKLL